MCSSARTAPASGTSAARTCSSSSSLGEKSQSKASGRSSLAFRTVGSSTVWLPWPKAEGVAALMSGPRAVAACAELIGNWNRSPPGSRSVAPVPSGALPVVANLDSMLSIAACSAASTLSAVAALGFLRAVAGEAPPSAAVSNARFDGIGVSGTAAVALADSIALPSCIPPTLR